MRTGSFAAIAAFIAVSISPSAFAREQAFRVSSYERSLAAAVTHNWAPTVLIFTHGGATSSQIREYEAVLAERPYRWAHVLIVDVDADPAAARQYRAIDAPSFTILRAGGDYLKAGEGDLTADALRRELNAALAAPVGRASVD